MPKHSVFCNIQTKVKEFRGHSSRVLHMAKSPLSGTVVSAGADETLRFWDIFTNSVKKQIDHSSTSLLLPMSPGGGIR